MLAGFLAVFEAIAVAVQLEDVDVMGQPVEQRASQPFGAEDLGPFVEGQIRGHERRCLLVAREKISNSSSALVFDNGT